MNTCPSCGLPTEEYVGPPLTAIKFRIFQFISSRPGVSAEELADLVYSGYPKGGPESGRKTIHAHINQINRTLASIGSRVRIRGSKYHGYRVLRSKGETYD